jgi:hypothetical protein
MLDQVGIAFSEGATIISEMIFYRVSEYNWDLDNGGKLALVNLAL